MLDYCMEPQTYDSQVQGLVAMLDEPHTARVKELWSKLDVGCGLKAIYATPYPHFSFHIAERYDLEEIDAVLTKIVKSIPPFTVRTTGLSFFTGPSPVVFVPLVASQELISIHQLLWEQTTQTAERLSVLYSPGRWVPHITLANKDVRAENIGCVTGQLSVESFDWEIEIRQFGLVCQEEGVADLHSTYTLGA